MRMIAFISPNPSKPSFCAKRTTEALETAHARASSWMEERVTLSWMQWGGLLWLGIFIDAVGYLWWAMALQQATNSAAVANLAYAVPLLSLVVSALTLGERMTGAALLALVLIMGGILLQNVRRGRG